MDASSCHQVDLQTESCAEKVEICRFGSRLKTQKFESRFLQIPGAASSVGISWTGLRLQAWPSFGWRACAWEPESLPSLLRDLAVPCCAMLCQRSSMDPPGRSMRKWPARYEAWWIFQSTDHPIILASSQVELSEAYLPGTLSCWCCVPDQKVCSFGVAVNQDMFVQVVGVGPGRKS